MAAREGLCHRHCCWRLLQACGRARGLCPPRPGRPLCAALCPGVRACWCLSVPGAAHHSLASRLREPHPCPHVHIFLLLQGTLEMAGSRYTDCLGDPLGRGQLRLPVLPHRPGLPSWGRGWTWSPSAAHPRLLPGDWPALEGLPEVPSTAWLPLPLTLGNQPGAGTDTTSLTGAASLQDLSHGQPASLGRARKHLGRRPSGCGHQPAVQGSPGQRCRPRLRPLLEQHCGRRGHQPGGTDLCVAFALGGLRVSGGHCEVGLPRPLAQREVEGPGGPGGALTDAGSPGCRWGSQDARKCPLSPEHIPPGHTALLTPEGPGPPEISPLSLRPSQSPQEPSHHEKWRGDLRLPVS